MKMSLKKRILSGPLALLVGLSAVCLLLFADASSAAVPPVGVNCVATDGKINGRGATYQTKMQEAFANGFRDSVCGPTEDTERSGSEKEPAGNTMVAYNYPKAAAASATGSGNGLKAATCRTDAYAGSDIPYLNQQLVGLEGFNLWGPPGELEHDKANGVCNIAFTPPYPPNESAWPNEHDQEAEMMSFPVTGSSVALVADLPTEKCNGTKVNKLEFTPKEVTRIFGGDAHTWNDTELRENNTELAECHDEITRVVRQDTSGTTNIFKSYLVRAANERAAAGATCGTNSSVEGGSFWEHWIPGGGFATEAHIPAGSSNTEWPGKQNRAAEGGTEHCTLIETATKSGGQELIKKLRSTPDGVGYADLADTEPLELEGKSLVRANVQNATATSFQAPNSGTAANCTFSAGSLPLGEGAGAVGLNKEDNWSSNNQFPTEKGGNERPNHQIVSDKGRLYPICGVTFDLVPKGLHADATQTERNSTANSRLTPDQRRTMYSYFTFILSLEGQEISRSNHYAPLPTQWLPRLREGFQANF